MFNGNRVPVWEEKKVLEMEAGLETSVKPSPKKLKPEFKVKPSLPFWTGVLRMSRMPPYLSLPLKASHKEDNV